MLRRGVLGAGAAGAATCLLLAAAVYAASLGYDPLNHGPNAVFLRTRADEAIPLVPVFAVPYVSLNPVVYASLVLFLLVRVRTFQSAAVAMVVTFLAAYTVYLLMQSYVARPAVTGGGWAVDLVGRIYAGDHPYNDFPSLHAAISTVLALHWPRVGRRTGAVAGVWLALIVVSTVFVHQHYIADVAAGILLGAGASWLGWRVAALLPPRRPAPRAGIAGRAS